MSKNEFISLSNKNRIQHHGRSHWGALITQSHTPYTRLETICFIEEDDENQQVFVVGRFFVFPWILYETQLKSVLYYAL